MKKLISMLGVAVLGVSSAASVVACGGSVNINKHTTDAGTNDALNIDLSKVSTAGQTVQYLVKEGQMPSTITWDQIINNVYNALMNGTNFKTLYSGVSLEQIMDMTTVRIYDSNTGAIYAENNLKTMHKLGKDTTLKIEFIPYANVNNLTIAHKAFTLSVQWLNISDNAITDFINLANNSQNDPIVVPHDNWANVSNDNLALGAQNAFYKLDSRYQEQGYTVAIGDKKITKTIQQPEKDQGAFVPGEGYLVLKKGQNVVATQQQFSFLTEASNAVTKAINRWNNTEKQDQVSLDAGNTYLHYFVQTIAALIAFPQGTEFQPLDLLFSALLSGQTDPKYSYQQITTKDFMQLLKNPSHPKPGQLGGLGIDKLIQDLWSTKIPQPVANYTLGQNPYAITDDTKGWEQFWSDLNDGMKALHLQPLSYPDETWKNQGYFNDVWKDGIPMPVVDKKNHKSESSIVMAPIWTTKDISKLISLVVLRTAPDLINLAHFLHYYYSDGQGNLKISDLLTPLLQYLWMNEPVSGVSDDQIPAFYENDGYQTIYRNYIAGQSGVSYLCDLLFDFLGSSTTKVASSDSDPSTIVVEGPEYKEGNAKNLFGDYGQYFWPLKIGEINLTALSYTSSAQFSLISLLNPYEWLSGLLDQQLSKNSHNSSISQQVSYIDAPNDGILSIFSFPIHPVDLWTPPIKKWLCDSIIDPDKQVNDDYADFDAQSDLAFSNADDVHNIFTVQAQSKKGEWKNVNADAGDSILNYRKPEDYMSLRVKLKNLDFTLSYSNALAASHGVDEAQIHIKNTNSDGGMYFEFM